MRKISTERLKLRDHVLIFGGHLVKVDKEPKYRPYNDIHEMITDWMERFGRYDTKVVMPPIWVKDRNDCKYIITEYILHDSVGLFSRIETLTELFKNYTYLDGSPCGKEENA